jgi:hypothetical protein
LDKALAIIALVSGDAFAEDAKMTTQYFPCPPFHQEVTWATDCLFVF